MSDPERWDALKEDPTNYWVRAHIERYEWASKKIHELGASTVLDIGSGMGYGTHILHQNAKATGIERSQEAIEYALEHYPGPTYICSPIEDARLPEVEAVTAFEVIEHLQDPVLLIKRLRIPHFFGSVPIFPSKHANPYHLHDFTEDSIRELVGHYFDIQDTFYQSENGHGLTFVFYGTRKG